MNTLSCIYRSNVACETTEACDGVNCLLDVLGNGALFEATTSLTCSRSDMSAFYLTLREPSENGKQGDVSNKCNTPLCFAYCAGRDGRV